jgi:hypothetical protein
MENNLKKNGRQHQNQIVKENLNKQKIEDDPKQICS